MKATELYVRFFKSFNFDYIRKSTPNSTPQPWEMFDQGWYPHVRVSLEDEITTVVGANESGKSQLLDAIEYSLFAKKPERKHFCRYSEFFSVEAGKLYFPEFGMKFFCQDETEVEAFNKATGKTLASRSFTLLSAQGDDIRLVFDTSNTEEEGELLTKTQAEAIKKILPKPKRLHAKLELPDLVPIRFLAGSADEDKTAALDRGSEATLLEHADDLLSIKGLLASAESIKTNASAVLQGIKFVSSLQPPSEIDVQQADLAASLLIHVAGISREAFKELQENLAAGDEGVANGLVETMNKHLESSLDLERWWSQDKEFLIRLSARQHDLVFTIRDRTGTDYSFAERSGGLKHFLGFFTQFQAYIDESPAGEILLMDEPDAFLSSVAQRDLLRLFQNHIDNASGGRVRQLVYVTHSPFLIDRNHSERIRVVDKGSETEGTRVVKNAARNHYEPLRSAIGPFLAETAYADNCNVFVEGITDQVLIAGFSRILDLLGRDTDTFLNLNDVTIVPCGSANHVAYMVYLARGRDVVQPAAIVLLDADQAGRDAAKQLKRKIAGSSTIDQEHVMSIADVAADAESAEPAGYVDLEDLIDCDLLGEVTANAASEIAGLKVDPVAISKALRGDSRRGRSVDAINAELTRLGHDFQISKLVIARQTVDRCRKAIFIGGSKAEDTLAGRDRFEIDLETPEGRTIRNFERLVHDLEIMRRKSVRASTIDKTLSGIKRFTSSLRRDSAKGLTKAKLRVYFENVESLLDQSLMCRKIQLKIDGARLRIGLNDIGKALLIGEEETMALIDSLTVRD